MLGHEKVKDFNFRMGLELTTSELLLTYAGMLNDDMGPG